MATISIADVQNDNFIDISILCIILFMYIYMNLLRHAQVCLKVHA